MNEAMHTQGRVPGQVLALLLASLLAGMLSLGAGGCTSDPSSVVGTGLIETRMDSTLLQLDIRTIDNFAGLEVTNSAVPLNEQQALYMGAEKDTRTSILANYDLSVIDDAVFPDSVFARENIATVSLSLIKLKPYFATRDSAGTNPETGNDTTYVVSTGQPLDLYYLVYELVAPYDPGSFLTYPAAVPPFDPTIINSDYTEPNTSIEPFLAMSVDDLVRWRQEGVPFGLLLRLNVQSDPGLVGFGSLELTQYTEVEDVRVGTVVAPNLRIKFDNPDTTLLIPPTADTTVFEQVEDLAVTVGDAADGFTLRTGLRRYPAFQFTMANVPSNARINRAVLSVVNDTETSYGATMSIQVAEIVPSLLEGAPPGFGAEVMRDDTRIYPLSFRSNLRPELDARIEFDITAGLQRIVNDVNDEVRGLLLSGIEDKLLFVPSPDVTLPDFYYRQFNFRGLADPDPESRPYLKVWYSVSEDVSGGAP